MLKCKVSGFIFAGNKKSKVNGRKYSSKSIEIITNQVVTIRLYCSQGTKHI